MPSDAPTSSPPVANTPSVGMYVCSVGAAAAITIFDGVVNERSGALQKFGGWFSRVFAGSDLASVWFGIALLFFCLFAALMTFAYRPTAHKEAFLLGAGILALLNALVKPPDSVRKDHANAGFLISSAMAQASEITPGQPTRVYLGVAGPADATTDITVYDASNGSPVLARTIGQATLLYLPAGAYNFLVARQGYRSVVFKASLRCCVALFLPTLERERFDSWANLFGPKSMDVPNDMQGALWLAGAESACNTANFSGAQNVRQSLSKSVQAPFLADPVASKQLCWR